MVVGGSEQGISGAESWSPPVERTSSRTTETTEAGSQGSVTQARSNGRRWKEHVTNSAQISRRLLSVQEAAEYIGLSVHTVYTMVSQRRIPFVKVGRLTKFDVKLLDDWISKNTVMPFDSKIGLLKSAA